MKRIIQLAFSLFGFQIIRLRNKHILNDNNELIEFLGFSVNQSYNDFLKRGKNLLVKLKENKAKFEYINNKFIIEICDLRFSVNSWEELLILNEVFIDGIYNYISNEEFVLFDIGMNVGITSLFFSKNEKCTSIFSFEPFFETRKFAEENFVLNQTSNKIKVFNYGLGFPERVLKVNYNEEYKGSVGINGVADYINVESDKVYSLEIRDVAENIIANIKGYDQKIVLKIDCEGAEYEIINRLKERDLLSKISCLMIEWHIEGPHPIINVLLANNFKIFSFNESSKTIGMIYAIKE